MNVHPLPAGDAHCGAERYGQVGLCHRERVGEGLYHAAVRRSGRPGHAWSGDFFGEMSFLTGKPRTATVETTEDSVILEVTEDKLKEVVDQRPNVLDVLKHYSEMRSKGTVEKILESNK